MALFGPKSKEYGDLNRKSLNEINETVDKQLDLATTKDNYDILLKCYNFVLQELATGSFPIVEVDKFFNVEDKIYIKDFSRILYNIKSIKDFRGDKVNFKVTQDYIELKKNYDGGTFFVTYYYIPKEKKLEDTCPYGTEYLEIFKSGIAAEYLLAQGKFELALVYHNDYAENIKSKLSKNKR